MATASHCCSSAVTLVSPDTSVHCSSQDPFIHSHYFITPPPPPSSSRRASSHMKLSIIAGIGTLNLVKCGHETNDCFVCGISNVPHYSQSTFLNPLQWVCEIVQFTLFFIPFLCLPVWLISELFSPLTMEIHSRIPVSCSVWCSDAVGRVSWVWCVCETLSVVHFHWFTAF